MLEQQDTEDALQRTGRSDEEEGDSLQWRRVAQLLGGKYDRIDPVQALPLLPLQVNYGAVATMKLALPVVLSAVATHGPSCQRLGLFTALLGPPVLPQMPHSLLMRIPNLLWIVIR